MGLDPDRIPQRKLLKWINRFWTPTSLFSAAYKVDSRVFRLWQLKDVLLYSSRYALEAARFNRAEENQQAQALDPGAKTSLP